MKKLTALIALVVLAIGITAACGTGDDRVASEAQGDIQGQAVVGAGDGAGPGRAVVSLAIVAPDDASGQPSQQPWEYLEFPRVSPVSLEDVLMRQAIVAPDDASGQPSQQPWEYLEFPRVSPVSIEDVLMRQEIVAPDDASGQASQQPWEYLQFPRVSPVLLEDLPVR
jgi:hypothetical protein